MAPLIFGSFNFSPAPKGLMLSVPIVVGALMRFPLGLLSQSIGCKNATLVEMALIAIAMLFGFFFVKSFNDLLAMGVLPGDGVCDCRSRHQHFDGDDDRLRQRASRHRQARQLQAAHCLPV